MSAFCERYGLTAEQFDRMLRDGVLPTVYKKADEIKKHYETSKSMQQTADFFGISKSDVHYLLQKFK
jgi:hypothetical protein